MYLILHKYPIRQFGLWDAAGDFLEFISTKGMRVILQGRKVKFFQVKRKCTDKVVGNIFCFIFVFKAIISYCTPKMILYIK